jgi:hypothetical protein
MINEATATTPFSGREVVKYPGDRINIRIDEGSSEAVKAVLGSLSHIELNRKTGSFILFFRNGAGTPAKEVQDYFNSLKGEDVEAAETTILVNEDKGKALISVEFKKKE